MDQKERQVVNFRGDKMFEVVVAPNMLGTTGRESKIYLRTCITHWEGVRVSRGCHQVSCNASPNFGGSTSVSDISGGLGSGTIRMVLENFESI